MLGVVLLCVRLVVVEDIFVVDVVVDDNSVVAGACINISLSVSKSIPLSLLSLYVPLSIPPSLIPHDAFTNDPPNSGNACVCDPRRCCCCCSRYECR